MDGLDLLAVQGTLKSLLQHHSSKASILQHLDFFMAQFSYPYMTTGETIALTIQTFHTESLGGIKETLPVISYHYELAICSLGFYILGNPTHSVPGVEEIEY